MPYGSSRYFYRPGADLFFVFVIGQYPGRDDLDLDRNAGKDAEARHRQFIK